GRLRRRPGCDRLRAARFRFRRARSPVFDWLAGTYRKLSWVALLVGGLVTFSTLLFADIPLDRRGQPKPPLGWQLLQAGAGPPAPGRRGRAGAVRGVAPGPRRGVSRGGRESPRPDLT